MPTKRPIDSIKGALYRRRAILLAIPHYVGFSSPVCRHYYQAIQNVRVVFLAIRCWLEYIFIVDCLDIISGSPF